MAFELLGNNFPKLLKIQNGVIMTDVVVTLAASSYGVVLAVYGRQVWLSLVMKAQLCDFDWIMGHAVCVHIYIARRELEVKVTAATA